MRKLIVCLLVMIVLWNIYLVKGEVYIPNEYHRRESIGSALFYYYERNYPMVFSDYTNYDSFPFFKGDTVVYLRNIEETDTTSGVIYMIALTGKTEEYFKVVIWNAYDYAEVDSGYLRKTAPLAICDRVYRPDIYPLKYYSSPNTESVYFADTVYRIEPLRVLDYDGLWLKVERKVPDTILRGWVHPDQLCNSPLTTCP